MGQTHRTIVSEALSYKWYTSTYINLHSLSFFIRPCDYYHYRRREQPVEMAFGHRRYIIPAYAVFCGPENKSKCYKCQSRPLGDYYHNFNTKTDLCRPCMNAELRWLNNCKVGRRLRARRLMELGCFKPSRWCDFFHRHHVGTWFVEKYPRLVLRKKNNIENYLESFDKLTKWYVNYWGG